MPLFKTLKICSHSLEVYTQASQRGFLQMLVDHHGRDAARPERDADLLRLRLSLRLSLRSHVAQTPGSQSPSAAPDKRT